MWSKIPGVQGTEKHDLLRWGNVPVASVKKRETVWCCSLLCRSGTNTVKLELPISLPLSRVREIVESTLKEMGWEHKPSTKGFCKEGQRDELSAE